MRNEQTNFVIINLVIRYICYQFLLIFNAFFFHVKVAIKEKFSAMCGKAQNISFHDIISMSGCQQLMLHNHVERTMAPGVIYAKFTRENLQAAAVFS